MTHLKTNRNYKDTLFRLIFSEKEEMLSLYNALNGSKHKDMDGLKVTTLDDALFMGYKNDTSFIIAKDLVMWEHQASECENMPVRSLAYVSAVYSHYISGENLYGSKIIKLPRPQFVVFYNGEKDMPERSIQRLSDAYEGVGEINLELKVIVLNINKGYNEQLIKKCEKLGEYVNFIDMVRQSLKTEKEVTGLEILTKEQKNIVIREVAEECIKNDILKEFLVKNLREVENMSIWEYDEEKHIKMEREDAYKDGEARGIALGEARGITLGEARGIALGEARGIQLGEARGITLGEARGIQLGREEGEENERRKNIITTATMLNEIGIIEEDIRKKIIEKYNLTYEQVEEILGM